MEIAGLVFVYKSDLFQAAIAQTVLSDCKAHKVNAC